MAITNSLTDTRIKALRPRDRTYRVTDGGGMFLEVQPSGAKYWRMAFRFAGKQRQLAIGVYPTTTLAAAREARTKARKQLANGIDPSAQKQTEKAVRREAAINTFQALADAWLERMRPTWADSHYERVKQLLNRDVHPWLGKRPAAELQPRDVLGVAKRIEGRGAADTAHRCLSVISQVLRYGVAQQTVPSDCTRDLRGALAAVQGGHFAAVVEPKEFGGLLRAIDGYTGSHVVRCALKLAPLLFVRPGELRTMRWADVDLDAAEWRYTVSKTTTDHIVPLSTQAVEILRDLHALTGHGANAFPNTGRQGRCMSENTLGAALKTMGYKSDRMTVHGFRSCARTLLDEQLGERVDLIEHQLAHRVKDPLGRAYNRTQFLDERRRMMQGWSDYCDRLRGGAAVIELGAARHTRAEQPSSTT